MMLSQRLTSAVVTCDVTDLEDELEEEDAAPPTARRRRGTDADAIGDFLEVCVRISAFH